MWRHCDDTHAFFIDISLIRFAFSSYCDFYFYFFIFLFFLGGGGGGGGGGGVGGGLQSKAHAIWLHTPWFLSAASASAMCPWWQTRCMFSSGSTNKIGIWLSKDIVCMGICATNASLIAFLAFMQICQFWMETICHVISSVCTHRKYTMIYDFKHKCFSW